MHWLQAWQYRRKVIIRISVGQQGQRRRCWPCTSTYAVMVGVGIPRGCWERVVAKTENRAPLMSSFNISITECFLIGCGALFETFFCGFPLFFFCIVFCPAIWFASSQMDLSQQTWAARAFSLFESFVHFLSHKVLHRNLAVAFHIQHKFNTLLSSWL